MKPKIKKRPAAHRKSLVHSAWCLGTACMDLLDVAREAEHNSCYPPLMAKQLRKLAAQVEKIQDKVVRL